MKNNIPIWEKYALSAEEAAEYFNIGVNKMRIIINNNHAAEWLIKNGNKALIKRKKFEQLLDRIDSI